jgi:hypothetical protein
MGPYGKLLVELFGKEASKVTREVLRSLEGENRIQAGFLAAITGEVYPFSDVTLPVWPPKQPAFRP